MKNTVIGVAGGTGSGKTTVALRVMDAVGVDNVAYLQHDSYYRDHSHLTTAEREKVNYDHPDELETVLLIEQIKALMASEPVEVPVYDFATHTRRNETVVMNPQPIILIEGMLILADKSLRNLMDIKVFVGTDADIRFIRRLKRDIQERGRTMESIIVQYEESVRPMHSEFVEPSKQYADIIIPEGGLNEVGVDMFITKVRSLLSSNMK